MNDALLSALTKPPEDIITNDLSEILPSTAGWSLGAYGWRSERLSTRPAELVVPELQLDKIKEFRATLTAYYDKPTQVMHVNYITITLSDGRYWVMGSRDAWYSAAERLRLYDGWGGANVVHGNIINREFVFRTPEDATITSIGLMSGVFSGFSSGDRGMKDFKFIYS